MKLAEVLSQIAGIVDVYAIPNAKVPIVKFKYEDTLYHFESELVATLTSILLCDECRASFILFQHLV